MRDLTRLFICESHDIMRAGIRSSLVRRAGIVVTGDGDSVDSCMGDLARLHPDVVLLGVGAQETNAADQVLRLRRTAPRSHVILMTWRPHDQQDALRSGAAAVVSKDVSADELHDTINAIAAGRRPTPVARPAPEITAPDARDTALTARLTPQERKILSLIGEGLSNREIAAQLFLAEKTVRNHVTRLLAKLGATRRTQAALLAARLGLGADGARR